MDYPSIKEIETADLYLLKIWNKCLPKPGVCSFFDRESMYEEIKKMNLIIFNIKDLTNNNK